MTWHRSAEPLLEADARWYEKLDREAWIDEAWRDPFVLADPGGQGWHMLLTARVPHGDPLGRSVIGHAWSPDLDTWEVRPPLTVPAGFGQLEVPQSVVVAGQPVLVFSCWPDRMTADRRAAWTGGGVWVVPGESLLGPWDIAAARPFDHPSIYAARLVQGAGDASTPGGWGLIGFRDTEDGVFIGEIADPLPVEVVDGTVRLAP